MSPAQLQRLIVATPNAVSCELAGEAVILDASSGQYFALDAIGSRIWEWLQKPCTPASLCERLMEEYDVEPERCEADVATLINQMAEHGLVRFEDAA